MGNGTNETFLSSDDLCQVAKTILRTPAFPGLLIAEIVCGLVATVLNGLLLLTIWRVGVFHRNLRLLLLHFSFSLLWYSIAYVVKAAGLLPRTFGLGDPCLMEVQTLDCRIQEIPNAIPVQLAVYTELAISLERLYSTVRYRKYSVVGGRCANFPLLALLLIPLCYVVPVFNIVSSLVKIPPGQFVAICENLLSLTPSGATTSLANNLTALLISLVCVGVVWYWNGHKLRAVMTNKAKHTLASRFQIDQNIQINKIIVPACILQLCCYIPNYVFMFLVVLNLPLSYEAKTILIHVNYLWKNAYAVLHPAVVLKQNAHVRKKVRDIIPSSLARVLRLGEEVSPVVAIVAKERNRDTKTHFEMLEDAWNRQIK